MLLLQRCGRKSRFAFSICCWLNSAGPRLGLSPPPAVKSLLLLIRDGPPERRGTVLGLGGQWPSEKAPDYGAANPPTPPPRCCEALQQGMTGAQPRLGPVGSSVKQALGSEIPPKQGNLFWGGTKIKGEVSGAGSAATSC